MEESIPLSGPCYSIANGKGKSAPDPAIPWVMICVCGHRESVTTMTIKKHRRDAFLIHAQWPTHCCISQPFQPVGFLLGGPKAEQASRIQLRVTFSLDLFIFVCTPVHFWHYRLRLGTASSPQDDTEHLIAALPTHLQYQ